MAMPKRYKRTCDFCGQYYEGQGARFCSMSCRMKDRNRHDNPAKRPDVRAKLSAAAIGNQWCKGRNLSSQTRAKIAQSLNGRPLSPEHCMAIQRAMTPAVRNRISVARKKQKMLSGPNHPRWQGGHTTIRQSQYQNPQYLAFRAKVVVRDNWTCQDCGARGGQLHVHHILPWGPHPELRYAPGNGVTLCVPCHHARHKNQPRPVTVGPRTLSELYQEGQDAPTPK